MIRTLWMNTAGEVTLGDETQIDRWRQEDTGRLWIDVQGEPSDNQVRLLESFQCHPLAIADSQRERHPPKIEEFESHTLILYRGISSFDADLNYEPQQISFFVGDRVLISLHPGKALSIERVMEQDAAILMQRSTAHIALKIMHISAGYYLDSLIAYESQLGELEDGLLEAPTDQLMKEVINYRSKLVKMRRIFNYHLAITQELSAYDYKHLPRSQAETMHAITDVYERFERLHSLTQMYYDICGDLINGYISLSSHQLNNTMRILTVITAIFVPLSFIAGVYGMNFENMPELGFRYGYFVVLGCMMGVGVGLLWLFRRKGWV